MKTIVNTSKTLEIIKPLKDCDLVELKIISSWELIEKYRTKFSLIGLSSLINNAIKTAVKEKAV